MKNYLKILRKEIDALDKELLNILSKRMTIVEQVGMIKKEKGIPPLDKKRWEEVLSSRIKIGQKQRLGKKLVETIWNAVHEEALEKEKNI